MHKPVLLQEVIKYLNPNKGDVFIDGTYGNGGHSHDILKKIGVRGKLLGIDMDIKNIDRARKNKQKNLYLAHDNFKNIDSIAERFKISQVNGILLDLGMSSEQLDDQRGFSFKTDSPLDMRMDTSQMITAKQLVNRLTVNELYRLFKELGEERYSLNIARAICSAREKQTISTTKELTDIILQAVPSKAVRLKIHPATRIFQALRIAVNDELNNLMIVLPKAVKLLKKNGRICVIAFHSLEDRIVKQFFKQESLACICPPVVLRCQCAHQPILKILTKKPVIPTDTEIKNNPRSRSAKMRVAEKII